METPVSRGSRACAGSAVARLRPGICYPPPVMKVEHRNRLIIGVLFILAGGFIAYQMFYSLTPPRHADHDHAMATIDAGGFLWLDAHGGGRRNLVGKPGKVLVLHWFDPDAEARSEQEQAARFAATVAADPMVEVLFVAQADSWDGLDEWAAAVGVPSESLFLDKGGRTGELMGVRRLPETLIYDPAGVLAHQARGPMSWSGSALTGRIERAKAGVDEIA